MIDIINGINSTITLAKKALSANEAMKNSETKLIIADLISELAKVKIQSAELLSENQDLKSILEKNLEIQSEKLELIGDVYMKNGEGPFCTTCWDNNSKKIRLKEEILDFQGITGHKYICPICNTNHKG